MSWSTYKEGKCCAACANWDGPRKLGGCKSAQVDSVGTKGKCYLGKGPSNGTNASYGCPSFEVWAALK